MNTGQERLTRTNAPLFAGGLFSVAFALFQIGGIFWSPEAITYFGGPGELSEVRPVLYAALCLALGAMAGIAGVYALAGSGRLRLPRLPRLPMLRTVIAATTAVYLLHGLLLIPQIPVAFAHPGFIRFLLFSTVSLCVGLIHLAGLMVLFRRRADRRHSPAHQTDDVGEVQC